MEEKNIMLLFQLTRILQDSFSDLKKAYDSKDYEGYAGAKESILDIQNKISLLLKQI